MTSDPLGILQGKRLDTPDDDALRIAVDAAVGFRGDVTITTSGGEQIEGYAFDAQHEDPATGSLRLIRPSDGSRISIPLCEITSINFTGRDTAAGRSFETWVKHYADRKQAGLAADLWPDESDATGDAR